jgi:hypothetical protein
MAGLHTYSVQEAQNAGLGQVGSIHVAGTTAVTTAKGVFVAITFLEDTTFNTGASGLIPESSQLYPSSDGASTDIDSDGGVAVDSETFPKGITIYGRWTGFQLATGKVIAYIG